MNEFNVSWDDNLAVSAAYAQGYLFGRKSPGYMYETRSLRVNLRIFTPTSENRRILKKFSGADEILLGMLNLPIVQEEYDWRIHKLAKDFYGTRFPEANFSASKIKELLTAKYHFNGLLSFTQGINKLGYAVTYRNDELLHYCYPFYVLDRAQTNLGMYMMLQAILWAQIHGLRYCYLGGLTRHSDLYKLQFNGLEWWTGELWSEEINTAKSLLNSL